jgi:tetratricopeptide (TPR) repeat protein
VPEDDLRTLAAALTREIASEMKATFPRIYQYLQDVTGSPAMAASPIKLEVLEAFRRDDFASQLAATQRLVETFPTELDAWVLRLSAVVAAYDAESTAENMRRMEANLDVVDRIDPENPYSPTLRGTFLNIDHRYRESVALLNEVLLREDLAPPMRAWALRQRAQSLANQGELDTAIADLRESLRLDPTTVFSYGTLTVRLLVAGRADEALTAARQGLALAPESWFTQNNVGHALGGLGRWDEALDHYEEACRLARTQRTCAARAHALQRTGRVTDAARVAREAAGMAEGNGGALGLARYHMAAGDRSGALRYFKRALQLGWPIGMLDMAPELAALRGDPELEAIISRAGR